MLASYKRRRVDAGYDRYHATIWQVLAPVAMVAVPKESELPEVSVVEYSVQVSDCPVVMNVSVTFSRSEPSSWPVES